MLCDGACMRAFHAGVRLKEEGAENLAYVDDDGPDQVLCNPLQMGAELYTHYANNVNALLECPNCLAHRHQCFICKQEGNSVGKEEGLNPNWVQEVYRCAHLCWAHIALLGTVCQMTICCIQQAKMQRRTYAEDSCMVVTLLIFPGNCYRKLLQTSSSDL